MYTNTVEIYSPEAMTDVVGVTSRLAFGDSERNILVNVLDFNNESFFVGKTTGATLVNLISSDCQTIKIKDLLVKAVNNRTIERDFFRLYSNFLEGNISEDEFNQSIDDEPEKFVLKSDKIPSTEELLLALKLSDEINDVNDTEELASLFSFNTFEIENMLNEHIK